MVSGDSRRVTISADPAAAQNARIRVRGEFLGHFKEDFYVAAFERQGETSEYIFIRGASHADQAG
jgi:hypothetical protein